MKDYEDVWMFFIVLRLVMEKLDHLTAMKDYLCYCQEGIYNRILEKVTHYVSPKGEHKEMWMFTHLERTLRVTEYESYLSTYCVYISCE